MATDFELVENNRDVLERTGPASAQPQALRVSREHYLWLAEIAEAARDLFLDDCVSLRDNVTVVSFEPQRLVRLVAALADAKV
jgi:hypothetical protein